ncbi:hypothetical protein [Paraburkholderia sp. DHOC27]|uniref:hypothetical protein n=1 Tax=Paraburkholderia sp. DHOC27 TaxID=2303330 RepID=UPI0015F32924|nr:hypothetical protein [Paraburkholderia sp. DHOC27]
MIFPRSPIAGYMEIVPVDVMIKSAATPKTLQTHLIFSASGAVAVESDDLTLPHADEPS